MCFSYIPDHFLFIMTTIGNYLFLPLSFVYACACMLIYDYDYTCHSVLVEVREHLAKAGFIVAHRSLSLVMNADH